MRSRSTYFRPDVLTALPDAAGEGERVEAAGGGRHCGNSLSDPVRENGKAERVV
jgi:hypothetical protein